MATFWKHHWPHLALSSFSPVDFSQAWRAWPSVILRLLSSAPSSERDVLLPLAQLGVDLRTNYSRKRLNNVIGLFGVRGLPITVAYGVRSERTWP